MKIKFFLSVFFLLVSFSPFAQTAQKSEPDSKSIMNFEKNIIEGSNPASSIAETKYEKDFRVIVWNDPLIKNYKYSNETFDKLGYEFVKSISGDNLQSSKVYRSCAKGIVIEVTEWYNTKISISMQWYSPSAKKHIGYLMYCKGNIEENVSANKKEEQDKMSQKENELRNKILNSDYIYALDLSNQNELKITFDPRVLNILYDFYLDFKKTYPFSFDEKLANYKHNCYAAESRGGTPEDYAIFELSLFFDKSGLLQKISNDLVLIKGEGTKDINFNDDWFNKIKPLLTANKTASVYLDGKENSVNSFFTCYFTFKESTYERKIEFSKNKQGELSIPSSSTKDSKDLKLLTKNEKITTIKKDNYIATIKTTVLNLRLTHFNDMGEKENLTTESETSEIVSVEQLKK